MLVVGVFSILLSLITLGSTVAFQAVVSLTLIAFLGNYELSICVLIWRRLVRQPLPPARWTLGKLGLPINLFAAVYVTMNASADLSADRALQVRAIRLSLCVCASYSKV